MERLQQGLRRGERCEDLVARAAADLEYVAFDGSPEDSAIKIGGTLRIQALNAAHNWLATGEHDFSSAPPILALVAPVETMFRQGRLDPSLVVETADAIHAQPAESAEDREARVSMQMLVMGLGLWSRPDAAPSFEPIRDRLAELFVAMDQTETRSDAVLRDYAARLERDGFSEYAFRETTAALQDLSSETAEDAEAIHAAVLRMFDMSIPYAPSEFAQALEVTRSMVVSQLTDDATPLGEEAIRERCDAVLQTLKADLEAGAAQPPTVMRAITALQALGQRIADDDEATAAVLMQAMMQELPQIILPYAPAQSEQPFREAMEMMEVSLDVMRATASADPSETAVQLQAMNEQLARLSRRWTRRPYRRSSPRSHTCASSSSWFQRSCSACRRSAWTNRRRTTPRSTGCPSVSIRP